MEIYGKHLYIICEITTGYCQIVLPKYPSPNYYFSDNVSKIYE